MANSNEALTITWQWGGNADRRSVAAVDRVEKEGGGLFGILKSPSLADSLPDARLVHARIVAGDGLGGAILLRIPDRELPPTRSRDLIAIGYTEGNRAVCVAHPPAELTEDGLRTWLAGWRCPPAP